MWFKRNHMQYVPVAFADDAMRAATTKQLRWADMSVCADLTQAKHASQLLNRGGECWMIAVVKKLES